MEERGTKAPRSYSSKQGGKKGSSKSLHPKTVQNKYSVKATSHLFRKRAKLRPASAKPMENYGNLRILPREIRAQIWTYVVDITSNPWIYTLGQHKKCVSYEPNGEIQSQRTAILRVSRAIYDEAIYAMFTTNRFLLTHLPVPVEYGIHSLALFPLKEIHTPNIVSLLEEAQTRNKQDPSFVLVDSFYQFFESTIAHQIDTEKIEKSLLRAIRYLVLDFDSRYRKYVDSRCGKIGRVCSENSCNRGKDTYPYGGLAVAAVEFVNNCTYLHFLRIEINMRLKRGADVRLHAMEVLEGLSGLRGVDKMEAVARCEMVVEGHDCRPETCSFRNIHEHGLSDEYMKYLYECARQPPGSEVPEYIGTSFVPRAEWYRDCKF